MTEEDKEHWQEIWFHARALSEARGRPHLAAWLLLSIGSEALLSTKKADASFLCDTIYRIEKSLEIV